MSTVDGQDGETGGTENSAAVDLKLEVVVLPVADADRSKAFYAALGWRLDADFSFDNGFRVVQFTPPGSLCSVQFGTKITGAPPGSAHGLYLIVSDIDAVREELISRGAKVSVVFHSGVPGAQLDPDDPSDRVSGPTRITRATAPLRRLQTRTATAGCFKRSDRSPPGAARSPTCDLVQLG